MMKRSVPSDGPEGEIHAVDAEDRREFVLIWRGAVFIKGG